MTKVPNYPGDPNDKTDDTPFDALKDKSLKAAGYEGWLEQNKLWGVYPGETFE